MTRAEYELRANAIEPFIARVRDLSYDIDDLWATHDLELELAEASNYLLRLSMRLSDMARKAWEDRENAPESSGTD